MCCEPRCVESVTGACARLVEVLPKCQLPCGCCVDDGPWLALDVCFLPRRPSGVCLWVPPAAQLRSQVIVSLILRLSYKPLPLDDVCDTSGLPCSAAWTTGRPEDISQLI